MPSNRYYLEEVTNRAKVRLRIRPEDGESVARALGLPAKPLRLHAADPAALWLAPDEWLLTSDLQPATALIDRVDSLLSQTLHAATDASAAFCCLEFRGTDVRPLLSMGCGLDFDPRVFVPGMCAATRFADIPLIIVALEHGRFNLYLDTSYGTYLADWIEHVSGRDRKAFTAIGRSGR